MSRYVALLRGINVGGKNKVDMKQLRACLSANGFEKVSTYINSGNIIFEAAAKADSLKLKLERAIEKEFGFAVPTLVISQKEIEAVCKAVPKSWTNDADQKTDVLFLWPEIDSRDILTKIAAKPDIERVLYVPGALVWNIDRKNATRGSSVKLIKSDIYPKITIRNINTVRKIYDLMIQN